VAELGILQRLLVKAGGRIGDDIGVVGGVAELLVVGVAGVACIDE
jgi:hypothetical protein